MAGLISNGSFVLGDPNTRDLYLGKGLKDGFEGEKYYIATDETVLWEGKPTSSSFVITCSEDVRNFDKIEVTWSSYGRTYVDTIKFDGGVYTEIQYLIAVGKVFVVTSSQAERSSITYKTTDGINFNWITTMHGNVTSSLTGAWNDYVIITKIVGINRKREEV